MSIKMVLYMMPLIVVNVVLHVKYENSILSLLGPNEKCMLDKSSLLNVCRIISLS